MGIPCAHSLKALVQEDGVVTAGMFHRQWHLTAPARIAMVQAISTRLPCSKFCDPPTKIFAVLGANLERFDA